MVDKGSSYSLEDKRMKNILQLFLILAALALSSCGRSSGSEDRTKTSNTSGLTSPDDPAAAPAGAPPSYVSHTTLTSTQLEVTLTKEINDATGLNAANYLLSNGLQISSIAKKAGQPTTLV